MKLSETCTCGAEIEIEHDDPMSVRSDVAAWRQGHRCAGPQFRPAPEQRGVSASEISFGFVPDFERPAEVTA